MKYLSLISLFFISILSSYSQITGESSVGGGSSSGNIYTVKEINCSVEFPFQAKEVLRNEQIKMIMIGGMENNTSGSSTGAAVTPNYTMTVYYGKGAMPFKIPGKLEKKYMIDNMSIKIYVDSNPKQGNGCNAYMQVSSPQGSFMLNFIGPNFTCDQARQAYSKFFSTSKMNGKSLYTQ